MSTKGHTRCSLLRAWSTYKRYIAARCCPPMRRRQTSKSPIFLTSLTYSADFTLDSPLVVLSIADNCKLAQLPSQGRNTVRLPGEKHAVYEGIDECCHLHEGFIPCDAPSAWLICMAAGIIIDYTTNCAVSFKCAVALFPDPFLAPRNLL